MTVVDSSSEGSEVTLRKGKVNLVDLAGSEKDQYQTTLMKQVDIYLENTLINLLMPVKIDSFFKLH